MMRSQPLLELRDAVVVRDGHTILDIAHLELMHPEHVVILGPNGSGKSTLIGLLTRDIRPLYRDDPPVRFYGSARWDLFDARAVFGVVSADWQHRYDVAVNVRDVVTSGFFGSVGLHRSHVVTASMRARADELMDELGIEDLAERPMDTLSTGEARRALIARALVHDPRLLILDEPCAGLDPRAAHDVRETYQRLASSGRSVVVVTHHVEDIVPAISRAIILSGGGIVADGPVSEIVNSARLSEVFGFEATVESREGRYRLW